MGKAEENARPVIHDVKLKEGYFGDIVSKGAVMILPSGFNKASGLEAALAALSVAPSDTVAIGDAENDLGMLKLCGFSVAVANALDSVKREADWVTPAARGDGVAQMLDMLMTAQAQS